MIVLPVLMKDLADRHALEFFACLRAMHSQAAGIPPAGIRSLRVAEEMFAGVFERSAASSTAQTSFLPGLPGSFHVFLIGVCVIHDKKNERLCGKKVAPGPDGAAKR
jgi:hypothetical protein